MRDMEDTNEAAKRTAIKLMRLCEALEMEDAELHYSITRDLSGKTRRKHRKENIQASYRRWFRSRA